MFEKIKTYFKSGGDSINWVFGREADDINYTWTKRKGLNLYEISLYTNRAINKRSDKVGEVEFKLYRGEQEVENEWTELLNRPNPYHTGEQFWKLYQKYKDIFGECYIWKEPSGSVFNKKKAPASLRILRPDLVEKIYNSDETEIIAFDYTPTTGKVTRYEPEEIIYSYNPNPRYPLRGESLIRSGLRSIEVEIQANEYQAKSIKSGGNVDTVVKVKDAASPQQVREMREAYRKLKDEAWDNGTPNEPLFAGGDMDVLRMSLSPQELDYIESKRMTLDDIAILTGTPKDIMGVTTGSTYANADAAIRIFLRETIKPILLELGDVLNWRLIPDEFDLVVVDPTPEDKEEKRKDLETADKVHALTTNEKREWLGYDEIENGDDILIPFNLAPLGQEEVVQEQVKTKAHHPLRNEVKRREFGEMYVKKLNRRKQAVDKAVQDFFKDQKHRVTDYLQKALKSKSIVDDSFNLTLEVGMAKNALLPVIKDLFIEQGKEHMVFLGSDDQFNYTSAMDISLNKRVDLASETVNQTTAAQLQRAFRESTELGETRQQLVERIGGLYDDISVGRAEVIARTETHYALQTATLDAIRQSGIDMKIWVWAEGVQGGVRDDHRDIDGEEQNVEHEFTNGLMFPGDGGPEDSINCQCSLA